MRHYLIYCIKDHVARDYYGKVEKIIQLISEREWTSDTDLASILDKQITYITRQLPVPDIRWCIDQSLKGKSSYIKKGDEQIIRLKAKGSASVDYTPRCIYLKSDGDYSAETIVFELLRSMDLHFLAVERKTGYGGWLRPIKTSVLLKEA